MLIEQHVKGIVKFGGGSLFIWGYITAQGTGYTTCINGRIDTELYMKILDDEFLQTLKFFKLDKKKIIFQQDRDSKYISKTARK